MALGRAFSVAVRGLDGEIVEIEADITSGLPGVHLVGLPDAALQESCDRVRAAVTNCGNSWPMARLTLALSPATLPKMGSVYDIALAAAVLSAQQKKPWERLENTLLLGELSLDGRVRPVRGCCPPCWQPNVTVGRPSSFRPTTCPRPAWWTESTSGVFARWGSCRAGYAGPPAWPGGSPRPTPPPSLRRTSPMWWASPKHGSPSRWPPPGRITSC